MSQIKVMKILIVGGGNMGLTYAHSFLNARIVDKENLLILEKSNERAATAESKDIGTVFYEPGDFIKEADLLVLAVKPQDTQVLFKSIAPYIDAQQVILSIMAGITIETMQSELNAQKIIRAMPNLPAQIGVGMTVFTSSNEVTRIELVMVQNLLNATGKTLYVNDEKLIDAGTAISGSGPAYIFYFMQSMINAGESLGFSKSEAELLSYQTFKGAIDLFKKNSLSCEAWISKVASRGGTTEAALGCFENNEVAYDIKEAVNAAYERATELSRLAE